MSLTQKKSELVIIDLEGINLLVIVESVWSRGLKKILKTERKRKMVL